ncbi:MAG: hypothetical protein AAFV51_12445 [Pseudomonadota bacterium]
MAIDWKPGRGTLGPFKPLLGAWIAKGDGSVGAFQCIRTYEPTLGGKYVKLVAEWRFGEALADLSKPASYEDLTLFGPHKERKLGFWSFTSDGKRSEGWLSTAEDVHAKALCFEADMDAGRARQVFYPDPEEGWRWRVQRQVKKGWSEIVAHHYITA